MDGVEVVAEVGKQRADEILALQARKANATQLVGGGLHKFVEQAAVFHIDIEPTTGQDPREAASLDVEHCTLAPLVGGIEAEVAAQLHHKPEVEVVDTLLEGVECHNGVVDKVEEWRIGLHLADEFVEQFGHKECHGALSHIEGYALQWHGQSHLLEPVELGFVALEPHEIEQEHRLKERPLAPLCATTLAKTLHHIASASTDVGQQVGDHRRLAILEGVEDNASGLVLFHVLGVRNVKVDSLAYSFGADLHHSLMPHSWHLGLRAVQT